MLAGKSIIASKIVLSLCSPLIPKFSVCVILQRRKKKLNWKKGGYSRAWPTVALDLVLDTRNRVAVNAQRGNVAEPSLCCDLFFKGCRSRWTRKMFRSSRMSFGVLLIFRVCASKYIRWTLSLQFKLGTTAMTHLLLRTSHQNLLFPEKKRLLQYLEHHGQYI